MNLLGRAIARELILLSSPSSSSSSRKCILYLLRRRQQHHHPHQYPLYVLINHSSLLYSTATTTTTTYSSTRGSRRLKNQEEEEWSSTLGNPKPQQQPPPSQEPLTEVEMEKGLPKKESESVLSTADWPRPSGIPWQAKVANSVNLVGRVQIPVQFEASPDGKYWAGTIISQGDADSSDSPPFWIPIIFEGDLAHIAACHLKAKDRVFIAGQLSADPPPFTMSQGQANVQVMVRSVNFVEGSSQMKKAITPQDLWRDDSVAVSGIKDDGDPAFKSWRDLLRNPREWQDNRENKLKGLLNPRHPDFKHKDSGLALWLNRAPKWVLTGLEGQDFDVRLPKVKQANEPKGDEAWKNLVENSDKWWDNRTDKLNPRQPDFKHKDSGLALWLDSAPKWVLSELEGLKFNVQHPKVKQAKESEGDYYWINLVENPDEWFDNRTDKVREKSPDFKHKLTGKALWLSDSPAWVLSRLPPLKEKRSATATITRRNQLLSETM